MSFFFSSQVFSEKQNRLILQSLANNSIMTTQNTLELMRFLILAYIYSSCKVIVNSFLWITRNNRTLPPHHIKIVNKSTTQDIIILILTPSSRCNMLVVFHNTYRFSYTSRNQPNYTGCFNHTNRFSYSTVPCLFQYSYSPWTVPQQQLVPLLVKDETQENQL